MKYISINELANFQYHDTIINKIDFKEKNMIWEVLNLNVTTQNTQNNFGQDMCIKNAKITFENAHIETFVLNSNKDNITIEPEQYFNVLQKSLLSCWTISYMEELLQNEGQYKSSFEILNFPNIYNLKINFSKSIVEWNEFNGIAWYERTKKETWT